MYKEDRNILVSRLAADILNKKIYTKVRREVLDLYTSRDSFYKKPRVDVVEQVARIGIKERKNYEALVAVLSAYSDQFTADELKGHFYNLFFDNMFDSVNVNQEDESVELVFPSEPDFAFISEVLSLGDYLINLCNVDLLGNLSEELDNFLDRKVNSKPPLDVILRLRQFSFIHLKPLCEIIERKTETLAASDSDKDLITRFHPDTPFYDACFYAMRAIFEPGFISSDEDLSEFEPRIKCDLVMNVETDHIISSALEKLKGNVLCNADFRSDLRKANQNEDRVNRIAMYVCMQSWLVHAMICGQKHADDLRILEMTHLTKQEIRRVIASTLLWAERNGITPPDAVMEDAMLSSLLANDMVRGGFDMVLRKNRKDSIMIIQKQVDREEKATAKNTDKTSTKKSNGLERVLEENSRLKSSEQQLRQELKSKKDIEKKMKGEMSDMKKDLEAKIKKLRQELEKAKVENEELQQQLLDDEFASDESTNITKEDVLSVAEGKKVLVWGIRPEIAERLSNEYPDIVNCIIMEDGRGSGNIPSGALDKCDAAIIVTNYSSHGMYYKARDEIKASGLPYAHARKNVNSPDRFGRLMWKVLTGIGNRNLKE